MNAIAFTGVAKSYGSVRAVEGLDLTIEAGSTVALLGPNGAGKSTSIGMLLGLVRPSAGEIRVFGDEPDAAVKRGRVGAMLQDGDLVPGLTVREVVSFVRGLYPDPMPLAEILTLANLTDLAGRRADRLSGGQAQRVRFAIAVAGAPRLLVLDEPTAAMDVESRRSFWASMREYAATGRTVLFATHYLEEADENADRVIVIARGRVVADGSPQEIKAAVGTGTVRFTIGDQPTAGLDALPGVSAIDVRGAIARLRTTDPDATVQALYATGLRVSDLEVKGADLEDAFLSLTHDR
ncbi:ABC transporter ATP-binding protein [Actinoallomurus sp. NPDC052308]|uniref:ABC transporter ATP-binding protein n=1 Tax=Actinoallomurus sp. NPDC052308 TaxID=3155530 RepID=UPI003419E65E